MKKDFELLQRTAVLLSCDVRRVLGDGWGVTVEDGPTLVVIDSERTERVLLEEEVDLSAWPKDAWTDQYRENTLQDDASETVSEELFEVLRPLGCFVRGLPGTRGTPRGPLQHDLGVPRPALS